MTREAGRLGMVPHSRVVQTSEDSSGQVYVPVVNWVLMAAAILLVVLFRTSSKLASTYGISISTTMVVTTVLAFVVARERGRWRMWQALLFLIGFLAIDLTYFGSNLLRIPHGGWFPVVVAVLLFTVMATWRRGGELLTRRSDKETRTIADLQREIEHDDVVRAHGTAVFVTPRLTDTPPSLTHHIRRGHAVQEQVVLLTVLVEDVPRTNGAERTDCQNLGAGFFRVVLHYGYMQQANVPSELAACTDDGLQIDLQEATYYVEHESPLSGRSRVRGMAPWRDHLFGFLMRNSLDVTTHYQIPSHQIVDLGLRVRI